MSSAVTQEFSSADAGVIAETFVRARLTATALDCYPGTIPQSLEVAYRCQEHAIGRWPDRVAGWKVAGIAPAWRSNYPEERLIGPAFHRNLHVAQPGEIVECPMFEGGFAAVEAELVIRVGADAPAAKTEWTTDEAAHLVGSLHIGIEVAGSPLATLNDLGSGAVISDFGNNGGIVVGAEVRDWRSIAQISALSFVDDTFVGRGTASLRQGALGALAFALAKCARRGRPLHAGDVISTGMITGVHDIRAGQQSRHVFEGYGEVMCRAVRAVPHPQAGAL